MTRRIRILYLIGSLDLGGAEGQLVHLVLRLDRTKFDPIVCCLTVGGPHLPALEMAGIPVHVIGFRGIRLRRSPLAIVRGLARVAGLMRRSRPDIVHGYLFWAYVLAALVGRATHVPLIVASRRSLSLFKRGRPHYLFIERLANRLTDRFVANSEAVRQDVIRHERIPADRISVIYNGVDVKRFTITAPEIRDRLRIRSGPIVGVVSNFIHYKGYEYFFDAWKIVSRRTPSAVALLIGDGPVRGQFEERARADGLIESVRFLGAPMDVAALLSMCDLFVHPSTQEGFSNAILEAMAAGKPVVATAVGGNVEALVDGVNGLLVPARDGAALASAICRLLEDAGERQRLGESAFRTIAAEFPLDRMVREYEALYQQLVSTSNLEQLRHFEHQGSTTC